MPSLFGKVNRLEANSIFIDGTNLFRPTYTYVR